MMSFNINWCGGQDSNLLLELGFLLIDKAYFIVSSFRFAAVPNNKPPKCFLNSFFLPFLKYQILNHDMFEQVRRTESQMQYTRI